MEGFVYISVRREWEIYRSSLGEPLTFVGIGANGMKPKAPFFSTIKTNPIGGLRTCDCWKRHVSRFPFDKIYLGPDI